MRFIIRVLCQCLFFNVALQCYQARLEFSGQGFGDIDNAYHELNDVVDIENTVLFKGSPIHNDKDTNISELEIEDNKTIGDMEEVPDIHEESEEKRGVGQYGRGNSEKRRMSKQERVHSIYENGLNNHNKVAYALDNNFEEETGDHDGESAHYYLTKPSEISNVSAMLGPGPVPIQIFDTTTRKSITVSPTVTVQSNSTRLSLKEIKHVANISSESDHMASFVDGHRKKRNRKKFKILNSAKKVNDAFMKWNDEFIPVKHPKKESRFFHKPNVMFRQNEREETNQKAGHKKRKHKHVHNEPIHLRKDTEKFHLNEEEQYTNLSAINQGFQKAASKKFDLKHKTSIPIDAEAVLNVEEPREQSRIVVDKIRDEDAKKICLLNAEREISEEEHTSLRDEMAEVEKKNNNLNSRHNPKKGIRSKIIHGNWVDQVTLLPLPDYSITKNRTHRNKKLSSVEKREEISKDSSLSDDNKHKTNKEHKKKKSVEAAYGNGASFYDTSEQLQSGRKSEKVNCEFVSDVLLENDGETENKRDERDTKRRVIRKGNNIPKERSIFNHNTDISYEKSDDIYDEDKHDEQRFLRYKNNDENTINNPDIAEKEEEDYEYDSRSKEDENIVTGGVYVANRSTITTETTCAPTTNVVHSTKPSRKPNKPKSTPKTNDKPEPEGNKGNNVGKMNRTVDPYEMFLCGQLADNFVNEVLKKVKISRKISRELGYSNETEETCDRCVELKPIKVPELAVMRSSLGKCLKNYAPVQNCSMCCGVPKPMLRYLDVLVYFEKENGNNFYKKIQDDSSFIFTGDYPESLSKGESSIKMKDKYVEERNSFNKDTFDKQRLREDLNEEKNEDKSASSDSFEKPDGKYSSGDSSGEYSGKDIGRNKDMQGGLKRYLRRFGKSKTDGDNERSFLDESSKDEDLTAGLNIRESDSLAKDSDRGLGSDTSSLREFGKIKKVFSSTKQENALNRLNSRQEPDKKAIRNFDRFYGKSNYDYYKQYPSKSSLVKSHPGYKLNFGDSSKNLPKDSRDRERFDNFQNPSRISNKADGQYNDNYFSYPPKYAENKKINSNENYKGFQSKYDLMYEDNGEYSLYPNLGGRYLDENVARISGNYKNMEGDNSRMVKRDASDAEPLPVYDDETNVFFEIPNIEYDLYK